MTHKTAKIVIGVTFLLMAAAIIFSSCSSVKKSQSKSSSSFDSSRVSSITTKSNYDSLSARRMDSTGSVVKNRSDTYERETVIEYDTLVGFPSNGDEDDYVLPTKQRVKKVTIKERGQILSKEVQTGTKSQSDLTALHKSDSAAKNDSSKSSGEASQTNKEVDRKSWIDDILSYWWLLIPIIIAFVIWKRKQIKEWIVKKIYKRPEPLRKV